MHSFSKVITAATGLLAFGSVASAWEDYKEGTAKDSCAGPEITTYHGIGGGGGGQFDACKFNEGIFPSKLEIWSDYEAVRGLVLTYSDGSHTEIGKKTDNSQKMEWNPSTDYINHLQLWDIGRGGDGWGISRISIGLNNNQKIDVGNDDSGYGADYTASFEAGALFMGITGRVSDRIERLDFVTSKTAPKSFAVTDMALDPSVEEVNAMAAAARGIKPKSILVVYGVNSRKKGEMKIWSEKTETETVTTSITNTKSQTFGVSVGWSFEKSFGLPTVAQSKLSVSNEYKWEKTTSEAKMEGTTNTTSIRGLVDTTVAPQTAVRCESWYLEARQEQIRWTGKVKITFADNNFLAFDSLGDYSTTQVSETIHSCEEVDMDVLEKAIKDGEEVQSDGKSKDEILNDVEELKHNNQTATARARMARSAKLRF